MTPADKLAALRALVEKMTPGPWRTDSLDYVCGETEIIGDIEPRDREGIVALRNSADALLAVAEAAQRSRAARRAAFDEELPDTREARNAALNEIDDADAALDAALARIGSTP